MKLEFKKLKEAYGLLRFIHSLDRNLIPIYILGGMGKAFEPYISIIGGAYIIDALINKDWRQGIIYAVVMILISGIVGITFRYIQKIIEVKSMTINRSCNSSILLKAISLDYATFEDKKNLEEFQAADYNVARNGGFGYYVVYIAELLSGIIGFLISLVLLIKLCFIEVKGEGILRFITSKVGSIVLIFLLVLVLAILYFRLSKKVNKKNLDMHKDMMDINQKMDFMTYRLSMDREYAKEIRLYNMQGMIYQEWKKLNVEIINFYEAFWKEKRNFLMSTSFLSDFVLLIAYIFVGLKTFVGAVSIGAFIQYVGAVMQMNISLRGIVEAINKISLSQSYLSFYTSFLEKKSKLDTGSLPVERRRDNEYEIEFHNVSFKYPGSEEYILKNVSVKLDMKSKFAIVGRNGAGKTTFIKLLCRFYDVTEGVITLNGVDIRKYEYEEYLNLFASVFQDFSLFSIPVRENVVCSEDLDEDKLWNVLECAGIKEKVESMSNKLDTRLYNEMGDGEDISGGEAQKIAIARALYKDAPFVILDEPTAALDPISEYEIYSRFNEMVNDKTSIYISHRMSSCRFCDDILVFDKGKIVQRGNHELLMKDSDNVYAKLWNAQAKYYAK